MAASNFIDTSKVFIREINSSLAKDLIVKNHYSHAWTMCSVALGVFLKHAPKRDSFLRTMMSRWSAVLCMVHL